MMTRRVAGLTCASLLLFLLLPGAGLDARRPGAIDRIDDTTFWRMFSEFSEPDGYFRSDNLVSNERAFPGILPEVRKRTSSNAAYVGVGPDQNFSYLAALRPRIAFIVDVRRGNAVLHLFYKALFEMSPTRAEFLSRLFSRPRPRHLESRSSVRELFEALAIVPSSADLFEANLKAVRSHLTEVHRFVLTEEDASTLRRVYSAFFDAGPDLTYSARSFNGRRRFPTFGELMTAVDDSGVAGSFLATEGRYQVLRDLHQRNLIVPVVGDFAGSKALKTVSAYLRQRGLTVAVFYTSNVEFYLFGGDQWRDFYGNLATFPVDRQSVLIRSIFRGPGSGYPGASLNGRLVLEPIGGLVSAFRRGEISSYGDLIARSK